MYLAINIAGQCPRYVFGNTSTLYILFNLCHDYVTKYLCNVSMYISFCYVSVLYARTLL